MSQCDRCEKLSPALDAAQMEVAELRSRVRALEQRIASQRHDLAVQNEAARVRNAELDALKYVWCDGGCEGGVHRYKHSGPLTDEVMQAARRNMDRLERWWSAHKYRQTRNPF